MAQTAEKGMRTCIGCGKQQGKAELMRLVRTAEGSVRFDVTGKAPGRGAYVCSAECLDNAFAARKLQKALRCGVKDADVREALTDMAARAAQMR